MFKADPRVLVIAVMLVAFVGQAIAFSTSMSCETSADSLYANFSEPVKQYDSKPIDTDNPEDCCGIECCDVDCSCISSGCSSLVYFHTEIELTETTALSEVVCMHQSEQLKSISTLLYRPPIFTS